MPHKQSVTETLTEKSDAVNKLNACNTLTKTSDGWKGDNTDHLSVKRIIEENRTSESNSVAIIGCGGFGRAAALAAIDAGQPTTLFNRSIEKAKQWAEILGCQHGELESIDLSAFDIVIQCSSAEMDEQPCPVDSTQAKAGSVLIESIYGRETQFLSNAPEGCSKILGAQVFQYQAEEQLALWSGKSVPVDMGTLAMTL